VIVRIGLLAIVFALTAQTSSREPNAAVEESVLPVLCATDPIYREFEQVQAAIYSEEANDTFHHLLSSDEVTGIRKRVLELVSRRIPGSEDRVARALDRFRAPTCYENPFLYFRMALYSKDVDAARRSLNIPLKSKIRFGSLPSSDINAYTYLMSNGRDSVVAFNAELFIFVEQLSSLAVGAVDPEIKNRELADTLTDNLLSISYNPEAKRRFVDTVVALIAGRPIATAAIDSSRELLVVSLTNAIERFLFAHEMGHIVKEHTSPIVILPGGATGISEYSVYARSWAQEFEADEVGFQLLTEILSGSAVEYPAYDQYYYFAMKAPLVFFEMVEVLDTARAVREAPRQTIGLTEADRGRIRQCAVAWQTACSNWGEMHPPAWLREERLLDQLERSLKRKPLTDKRRAALQKADEVRLSIATFARETAPIIAERMR
jgi:hypothetical protein